MRSPRARAALFAALAGAACRDSPVKPGAQVHETAPPVDRKPSCPTSSVPLDVSLRHEEWTRTADAVAAKAAASRISSNRHKLDGQLRAELAKHDSAVRLAENTLEIANLTVEGACLEFEGAFGNFRSAHASDGADKLVLGALSKEIGCWSPLADRQKQLDAIANNITTLDKADVAAVALRERWAVLGVALRERESAAASYAQAANAAATTIAKAATTVRLRRAECSVLSATLQALPKIRLVVEQLQFIAENPAASADGNMCRILRLVEAPGPAAPGDAAPSTAEAAALASQWQQRLETVRNVIDQALAVSGAEE